MSRKLKEKCVLVMCIIICFTMISTGFAHQHGELKTRDLPGMSGMSCEQRQKQENGKRTV